MALKKAIVYAAMVCVLVFPLRAFAVSVYQPENRIEIQTELTVQEVPGNQSVFYLTLNPARDDGHTVCVDMFNTASGQIIGCLEFFQDGHVEWDGLPSIVDQISTDSLLITPGISIPVDVLPVNRFLGSVEAEFFEFKKKAGKQMFFDRIRVSSYPVNIEEAYVAQWIKVETQLPAELYMIEASNAVTGSLLVRQLWAPGNAWWLFEQTPIRRSWRVR